MDLALLQPLLHWIAAHPTLAGLVVFAIALGESLAIVGLFIPGTLLLFGVGALVAAGSLSLLPTLAWCFAGAVVGDGASYFLGRRYHDRLRRMWPFRSRPGLLARGEQFFQAHGGKSVFLGRFVGPIRPVIPLVAGMLDMPARRFFAVNLLSGLAWAPAYLLPGVLFGASLSVASEVATRLAVLLAVAVGSLWLAGWLVHRGVLFLQPRADRLLERVLAWSDRHPLLGRLTAALVDPRQPESRALLAFALVLVAAAWLFLWVLTEGVGGAELAALNERIYLLAQGLRSPWGDHGVVALTELGDPLVLSTLALGVAAWLAWRRHWLALGHWLAAALFAALVPSLIKWSVASPRPPGAGADGFSFPSGHTTASVVLFGFLAVLVARELPAPRRWLPYAGAGLLALAIALSRLYLGVHWLSDVLGGSALGIAWVALLGIAYGRHRAPPLSAPGLLAAALLLFAGAGAWHVERALATDLARYRPIHEERTESASRWWSEGLSALPRRRRDLAGRPSHPLTLQWAAPLPAIRASLDGQGWQPVAPLTARSTLRWLLPAPAIGELPVLPQVHDGEHAALTLVRPVDRAHQWVLRLWPAHVRLTPGDVPLWVGNVSLLALDTALPLLAFSRTDPDLATPLTEFSAALTGWAQRESAPADAPPLLRLRADIDRPPAGT